MTAAARFVAPLETPLSQAMADALAALHAQCFSGVTGAAWSADAIRTVAGMPGARVWLSWNGEQIGGILLARAAGDDIEILTFGLLPEWRRSGQGRALMRATTDWARSVGINRVVLEVAVTNEAALNFYRNCGFTEVGRRKGYYVTLSGRVDALVLAAQVGKDSNENRQEIADPENYVE